MRLDCARDFLFSFSVFSAVLNSSREKIDIPGYARGESLELVSFCLRTLIYVCEESPVQRLFLYDWYALSRLEFNLFIVKDDNKFEYIISTGKLVEKNKIITLKFNYGKITWN